MSPIMSKLLRSHVFLQCLRKLLVLQSHIEKNVLFFPEVNIHEIPVYPLSSALVSWETLRRPQMYSMILKKMV